MAIQTKRVVEFDGGAVWWEYDYEDGATGGTRRITRFRGANNCDGSLHEGVAWPTTGTVTVESNGRTFTRTLQPGDTLDIAVPSQQQQRLDITIDDRGRVNGINHQFTHSAG